MSSNKTEKPTKKRIEKTKKKGQFFKPKDLIVLFLISGGSIYLLLMTSFKSFVDNIILIISTGFIQDIFDYTNLIFSLGMDFFLPFFIFCFLISAIPSMLLQGFVLAVDAVKINMSALNPINGIKRIFSFRTIKDIVKSIFYMFFFIIAFMVFWVINKKNLTSIPNGNLAEVIFIWKSLFLSLIFILILFSIIVVLFDYFSEYKISMKDMKMDKEEIKKEIKESEGNPDIKSQRKSLHIEILSEQVISDIKNSKFIISNPTHLAIGIYFKPHLSPIPLISVIEKNQKALAVIDYAKKNGIPVITNIKLARRIFKKNKVYDFINLSEIDEILRLITWLENVENSAEII